MILLWLVLLFLALQLVSINADRANSDIKDNSQSTVRHPHLSRLEKEKYSRQLGMDLPLFYLGMVSPFSLKNYRSIPDPNERKFFKQLSISTRSEPKVWGLYLLMRDIEKADYEVFTRQEGASLTVSYYHDLETLYNSKASHRSDLLSAHFRRYSMTCSDSVLAQMLADAADISASLPTATQRAYFRIIRLYPANTFNNWLFGSSGLSRETKPFNGLIKGDFGYSVVDGHTIASKLAPALSWSFQLAVGAILFSLMLGIILCTAAMLLNDSYSKVMDSIMLSLYSTPDIVFGLVILTTFVYSSGPVTSELTNLEPVQGQHVLHQAIAQFQRIIWPVLVLMRYPLSYFYLVLAPVLRTNINLEFILAARAKGLSSTRVLLRHVLPNSIFPTASVIPYVFPAAVSGMLLIEMLFGIPGMGKAFMNALQHKDYNLVVAVFLLSGVLLSLVFLAVDLFIKSSDPQISQRTLE